MKLYSIVTLAEDIVCQGKTFKKGAQGCVVFISDDGEGCMVEIGNDVIDVTSMSMLTLVWEPKLPAGEAA